MAVRNTVARGRQLRRRRVIERTLRQAEARGEVCDCGLNPDMTEDELRALEGGCTAPAFSCPVLDRVRRRLGVRGSGGGGA